MSVKYSISILGLCLSLMVASSVVKAQEVMLSPIVSDETGEAEPGLSDYAVENEETDIEPGPDSFAPLEGSVFDTLNVRQQNDDVRFSSTKFREDSRKIPLGEGLRPAAQINIQERLKRERAEKEKAEKEIKEDKTDKDKMPRGRSE